MKIKKYIDTYMLVRKLQSSKQKDENRLDMHKEKCENYFRCDDDDNDGRGNY